jgi:hypothetical protein
VAGTGRAVAEGRTMAVDREAAEDDRLCHRAPRGTAELARPTA